LRKSVIILSAVRKGITLRTRSSADGRKQPLSRARPAVLVSDTFEVEDLFQFGRSTAAEFHAEQDSGAHSICVALAAVQKCGNASEKL
jgi:hypothetical protein